MAHLLHDFVASDFQTLLGFGGLMLALGGLYWLVSDPDRRRAATVSREPLGAGQEQPR
jgi:hypothetical protein